MEMLDYAKNKGIEIPEYPKKMPESERRELSSLDKELIRLYRDEIFTPDNQHICKECWAAYELKNKRKRKNKRELSDHAIGHWFIGREFRDSKINGKKASVLFVGKNAVGNDFEKDDIGASFFCPCYGASQGLWNGDYSAYWRYTKAIVEKVFDNVSPDDDNLMEHIGITNLLKCNDGSVQDDANEEMKRLCINELAVIKEELKIIQPTHIIFYTGWFYDDYIKKLFSDLRTTRKVDQMPIGNKTMPWWEATVKLKDSDSEIKMLRVGHPERLYKYSDGKLDGFVDVVSDWLRGIKR